LRILQAPGSALEGKQKVDLSESENPSKPLINHKNAFGLKTNSGIPNLEMDWIPNHEWTLMDTNASVFIRVHSRPLVVAF
jgi:hypothetical protein